MNLKRRVGLAALSLLAVGGCGRETAEPVSAASHAAPVTPNLAPIDPWRLICVDSHAPEPALLWNGLIGIRIGRDGSGRSGTEDLPFFKFDHFDKAGEEKIQTLRNPLAITTQVKGQMIGPEWGRDYRQTLDMQTGWLETRWTQSIDGATLSVTCQTALDPDQAILGTRWTFKADHTITLNQARATTGIAGEDVSVAGTGGPLSFSADRSSLVMSVGPKESTVTWLVAYDHANNPVDPFTAAKQGAERRNRTDIEIDGPASDQQAIRSFMFYVRTAIHPKSGLSVAPFGLGNQQYNGHTFWDADIWVFPALALLDPKRAAAIPAYRLARLDQARRNFQEWIDAERPTADRKLGKGDAALRSSGGVKFPWESSVTGKETIMGPSRFEDHISGSVAWSMGQASALGLIAAEDADRVREGVGRFFAARSLPGPKGRTLPSVMSPDENHTGDNDLYTNLLAQWTLNGGTWRSGDSNFYLPQDAQSFLTYDGDRFKGYKQAAAILSIYPLQYPPAEAKGEAMMGRFEKNVIANGPAMTDSVHSIVWSRLGKPEPAYEAWKRSWQPFTQNPLLLFSEKRTKATTYFVTGAGGALQSVLYGFLGFRIDYAKESGAAWSMPLQNGSRWLSIKPNLPKSWKSVKFKNFTVLGRPYTLTVTPTGTHVSPGE